MRILGLILAALLLVPGTGLEAGPRSRRVVESDIATVKRQIQENDRKLAALLETDTKRKFELAECDQLDRLYTEYRTRLIKLRDKTNAAYREYKKLFRLASINLTEMGRDLWWSFCNTPYLGRLANWKWFGAYSDQFTAARNTFWATRDAYEREKLTVASELQDNNQLPLGLGPFQDYHAFKRAYLKRKAYCDRVVRPKPSSFMDLHREDERLRIRLAQLEKELADLMDVTPATHTAFIKINQPSPKHLMAHRMRRGQFTAGAGLYIQGYLQRASTVLQAGRLYRGVATVNGKRYTMPALAKQGKGKAAYLAFSGTFPARPGPFELEVSFPQIPGLRPVTVNGKLLPPKPPDPRRLELAATQLEGARLAAPNRPQRERLLCNAWVNLATYQRSQAEATAARQSTAQASAILKRNWPASRKWGYLSLYTWEVLASLEAQDAFEREDVPALERILGEEAERHKQVAIDMRQEGVNQTSITLKMRQARTTYRQLADTIVLLTDDVPRARDLWEKARKLMDPAETTRVPPDPDWFTH